MQDIPNIGDGQPGNLTYFLIRLFFKYFQQYKLLFAHIQDNQCLQHLVRISAECELH